MMLSSQVEPWKDFIKEAKPLLPIHYEELALEKDRVPLDPMYEIYDQRDSQEQVLVITVREDGALIGYFIGFIAPGLHYRTCLTLTMDIFYIHPQHRMQGAGTLLFSTVEQEAKRRGVNRLFVGSKNHKSSEFLFMKLGYTPVETYYSTWLGD